MAAVLADLAAGLLYEALGLVRGEPFTGVGRGYQSDPALPYQDWVLCAPASLRPRPGLLGGSADGPIPADLHAGLRRLSRDQLKRARLPIGGEQCLATAEGDGLEEQHELIHQSRHQ